MFDHEQHTPRPFLTSEDDFRHLRKSKDFYEHMVENSLGLIFAHDLSGRLLSVNAEAARMLEYSVDELLGANIYELFHPRVRRLFTPYLHRIAKHGEDRGELRLIKRTGGMVTWSYRNVLYSDPGFPPMIIGHALDITGHLQLEHRLEERTEQYRALFEDAPVAYHEINRKGVLVRVNKAECELLGWSREELLGRPVWQLISSGQQAASEAHVKRKLRGEQPLVPFVREYVRKDGQKLMFLIHENLILSTGGKILGIRSTLLDVTEQNRAESELRRMNAELDIRIAELEQSNRKLNEFVHMVSHDLQGPLRSISSFAELLRQRYSPKLDDDGVTFLNFVLSGAARMTALIQELLSYSRTAGGEIRRIEVDLNHALDAALENLHESVEAAGATVVRTSLPVVKASFVQMMQLFQNLVDNALKYRSEAAPVISVAAKQDGSTVCVSVSDNGIGIPEGERDRVFDLFKRASNVGTDGSGMGLAICQAIVERHNGRIWIEQHSPTEAGSTFSFTIAEG